MKTPSSITPTVGFIFALLTIANGVWFKIPALGILFFILLLLITGKRFGQHFFPEESRTTATIIGALLSVAWIMIFGSLIYYVAALNTITIGIIILSLPALTIFFKKKNLTTNKADPTILNGSIVNIVAAVMAYIIFLVMGFRLLAQAPALDPIRSPWEVLPWQFFVVVFLAATALIVLSLIRKQLALIAAIPFFFLFFSITVFVYPLGYGFDPFVHQATETYIAEHGTITPKPLTYIGQYALVNTIQMVTTAAIPMIDRLLLPLMLAIFLPMAGWLAFRKPLSVILLPMMPLAMFASTTPQAIGNALVLITVLLAIGARDKPMRTLIALWILGLATTLTHPLAGIPLLIFLFFWSMRLVTKKLRTIILWTTGLLGTIALPLLFIIYGLITGVGSGLRADAISRIPGVFFDLVLSSAGFTTKFNLLLDTAYLYGRNVILILVAGSIITAVILMRRKQTWPWYLLLAALVITLNGIFLAAGIDFSFLPLYEQDGYAARLFSLALLILVPLFILGLIEGLSRVIRKQEIVVRLGTIALLAGLLTTSLYLTYPHHDAYTIERGWSVGAGDFEAVQFINHDANDEPFIVLANQAVSAAALKEFGFKRYFPLQTDDGPITSFYYPIPTGGPLYEYFLKMSYDEPSRATIQEAMNRASVKRGYFVVNSYWFKSKDIIETTKKHTNDWWEFRDGTVTVFRFVK